MLKPITVTPVDVSKEMHLKQEFAQGTVAGESFSVCVSYHTGDYIITYNGKYVAIPIREILDQLLPMMREEDNETP